MTALHSTLDRFVYPLGRPGRFGMTPEQARAYRAILEYERDTMLFPTVAELKESLGSKSTSYTHELCVSLAERGWLKRVGYSYQQRPYEPTEPRVWFGKVPA